MIRNRIGFRRERERGKERERKRERERGREKERERERGREKERERERGKKRERWGITIFVFWIVLLTFCSKCFEQNVF